MPIAPQPVSWQRIWDTGATKARVVPNRHQVDLSIEFMLRVAGSRTNSHRLRFDLDNGSHCIVRPRHAASKGREGL